MVKDDDKNIMDVSEIVKHFLLIIKRRRDHANSMSFAL